MGVKSRVEREKRSRTLCMRVGRHLFGFAQSSQSSNVDSPIGKNVLIDDTNPAPSTLFA